MGGCFQRCALHTCARTNVRFKQGPETNLDPRPLDHDQVGPDCIAHTTELLAAELGLQLQSQPNKTRNQGQEERISVDRRKTDG